MSGQNIHKKATLAFSAVTAVLGAAVIVLTLARGGGLLTYGFVLGLALLLIGVLRAYLAVRR